MVAFLKGNVTNNMFNPIAFPYILVATAVGYVVAVILSR